MGTLNKIWNKKTQINKKINNKYKYKNNKYNNILCIHTSTITILTIFENLIAKESLT